MENLIDQLNLGPHDVTTIDETKYMLPRRKHERLYNKIDPTAELVLEQGGEVLGLTDVNMNEGESIVTKDRNRNISSARSRTKRARRIKNKQDIMDKTVAIRVARIPNNIRKKLQRIQKKRYKERNLMLIRMKRRRKTDMKYLKKSIAMMNL